MPDLKTLLELRANVWEQYKPLVERAKSPDELDDETRQSLDRMDEELNRLSADIERMQKADEKERRFESVEQSNGPADLDRTRDFDPEKDAEQAYRSAFVDFVVRGMGELSPDQRKTLRTGWVADTEKRAQSVGTTTAGGYLVPEGFRAQIIEKMKAYGAVEDVAQVITTSTGNELPWPTNDDTANVGALLAENTQVTEQDLTFGVAQLDAYKYTSKLVRVSIEFLQDVDWIDAEDFLARKFAERIARITNQHFTTGTGTAQPNGIVTGATSGVTAASATAITLDELIDLQHSIDPAYRNERSRFMFNDAVLKATRKLKDTTNQYIWQPSVQAGVASTLLGSPYVINNDMAVPATGVKSVLYGDFFAGYIIRRVRGFQLIRLDERYADFFQVGFLAFSRADADVQDSSAYKALTQA